VSHLHPPVSGAPDPDEPGAEPDDRPDPPEALAAQAEGAPSPRGRPRSTWARWLRVGLGVLLVGGFVAAYALLPLAAWLTRVAQFLRDLGIFGVLLYFGVYTLASLVCFPAAVLTLSAGFAWGALGGLAAAIPAAALAALTAFTIGRVAFRGRLRHALMARPRLAAVERAINAKGARLVFLMRFSPILPFPVLNYVLGMTRIPAPAFVLATATGMLPISFMYTWTGALLVELGGLDGEPQEVGPVKLAMGGLGLLATVFITLWVGRAARAALREVEDETGPQPF
jgi:uncharacterized membrane protein YdjX (TVP38/TMEM64 family)